MTKFCFITGKRTRTGNKVYNSNIKKKRKFLPNIQKIKLWSPEKKQFIKLKISTKGLKIINKIGIKKIIQWKINGKKN